MKKTLLFSAIFILFGCNYTSEDLDNAIKENNISLVEKILNKKRLPEYKDFIRTAIIEQKYSSEDIDNTIIERLVDKYDILEYKKSEIEYLVQEENYYLLKKIMLKGLDPYSITINNIPLPLYLIRKYRIDDFQYLIVSGLFDSTMQPLFNNFFLRTIDEGNYDIVKIMIDAGADLNYFNKHNYNALTKALFNSNMEITNLIINHMDDFTNVKNIWTALGRYKKVDLEFADYLWSLNIRDQDSLDKAIIEIAHNFDFNYLKWLLDHGADPNTKKMTTIGELLLDDYIYFTIKVSQEDDQDIRNKMYQDASKIVQIIKEYR